MTILDFELHIRASKVAKARTAFLNGGIAEIHKGETMWIGKTKIGAYKVQVDVSGIEVYRSACTCDSRRTLFCEHAVMMLFAIRKEMGLKPILASTVPKLTITDERLSQLLEKFNDADYEITESDTSTFTRIANDMIASMDAALTSSDLRAAALLGLAVAPAVQEMKVFLNDDYDAYDSLTDRTFALLERLFATPSLPPDLHEELFHDVRIHAVRQYATTSDDGRNWVDVLLAGADTPVRRDQFVRTMDALCQLVAGAEREYARDWYIERFVSYRDKLSRHPGPPAD